jgi:hypothetical protein
MEGIGKDPERLVKWPNDLGGGYLARIEVFHQLHCLVSENSKRDYHSGISYIDVMYL